MRHICIYEGCKKVIFGEEVYCDAHRMCREKGCHERPFKPKGKYCEFHVNERKKNYFKGLYKKDNDKPVTRTVGGYGGATEVWRTMGRITD